MTDRTRRLRDPIHGLIVFEDGSPTDMLAWRLIETPEFQRLRRIRQLGVSEFVFPGATHTRFAHSIGVYHNARRLMQVVHRALGDKFNDERARVILLAALLHDLGHGPFSHAFENARLALAKARGIEAIEKHEKFTGKLIRDTEGAIKPALDEFDQGLADSVAGVIEADDPNDIYHAVVSSSFDADRLDYLLRDRYMTGTGAGAIDCDWLIDNLDTDDIEILQDDDEKRWIPTFVFKAKGRQAAEDFLLARFRLYTQVYLHRATRGFERAITALILRIGEASEAPSRLGLDPSHPLVQFLRPSGDTVATYRELDDSLVWSAIECLRRCDDPATKKLANCLWQRHPLKVLDISQMLGHDEIALHNARRRLDQYVGVRLGKTIFRDEPSYDLYSRHSATAKEHKKVRVRTGAGGHREITEFSDTVIGKDLTAKRTLTRYYFLDDDDHQAATRAIDGR